MKEDISQACWVPFKRIAQQYLPLGDVAGFRAALEGAMQEQGALARSSMPLQQLHATAEQLASSGGPTNPGLLAVSEEFWDVLNGMTLLATQVGMVRERHQLQPGLSAGVCCECVFVRHTLHVCPAHTKTGGGGT
jgi:hypothetical protein